MSILLKLSFSYSFFGSGTRNESDLIAELEEINFQLVRNEKRDLQESIERCLHSVFESLKKKNYQE